MHLLGILLHGYLIKVKEHVTETGKQEADLVSVMGTDVIATITIQPPKYIYGRGLIDRFQKSAIFHNTTTRFITLHSHPYAHMIATTISTIEIRAIVHVILTFRTAGEQGRCC